MCTRDKKSVRVNDHYEVEEPKPVLGSKDILTLIERFDFVDRGASQKGDRMQTEVEIVVTEPDLDELGHVNNARYLNFLERGRMDWYAKASLFEAVEATLQASRFDTVVVNINIDFSRECLLGERLKVETRPERLGRKSLALRQVVKKPSGDLAAEAVVTSVVMDLQSRTAVVLPENLAAYFDRSSSDSSGQGA